MSLGNSYLSAFQEGASVTQVRRFPGTSYFRRRTGVVEGVSPPNGDVDHTTITIVWEGLRYPLTYEMRTDEEFRCFQVYPAGTLKT